MAFEPDKWANGEAGGTPITAAELNRIEAAGLAAFEAGAGVAGLAAVELDEVHLDTVRTPGSYSQSFSSYASVAQGYPGDSAGRLLVLANPMDSQVTQIYIEFATSARAVYYRNFYSSWGEWGPLGPEGPKGDTGAKGDKGDTGDTGPAGADGFPTVTQWNDLVARVDALEAETPA